MNRQFHASVVLFMMIVVLRVAAYGADVAQEPIPGIGPAGPVAVLHEGFRFTEGPAANADGILFFTDVPANLIYRANPGGEAESVLEDTAGTNGLMFDGRGRLFGCQGGTGRIVVIDLATQEIKPFAQTYNGKPFNRPNDLVVDRHGGVYFTDPLIGRGNQDKAAFYYASPDGDATRLGDDLAFPNGIALSPDEKTLYVLPFASPAVMAYPILEPGQLGPGRALCEIEPTAEGRKTGGDGMTVDTRGNLYLTAPALRAIQVVSPEGELLGLIRLPESPSNCTFGGDDMKTLFVTARSFVYAIPMEAVGHRYGGATP